MANEKTLQTRIILKHDTLANWQSDAGKAVVLKEGEVGLVKIVTQKTDEWGNIEKVPSYLMKVGDGTTTFENLNWLQACAADVHTWAKKTESEFTTWVKGLIDVGDIDLKDYVTVASFDQYKVDIQNGATTVTTFKKVEEALAGKQATGDYATKTEAKGYADAKDEAIAAAKKAGDDAQAAVDALTKEGGAVAKNATDIAAIQTDISTNYATKTYADQAETDAVTTAKGYTDEKIEDIQTQINTIINNPDAEGAINSINEFTNYITTHGTIAEGFRTDIDENATAIENLQKVGSEKNVIVTVKVNGAALTPDANRAVDVTVPTGALASKNKVEKGDLDTALATELDAKATTAALNGAIDRIAQNETDIDALQADTHTHGNKALLDTYTQTETNLADAVAKKHAHANAEELAKIASGDKAKWDAAEQNAKDYAKKYADDNFDTKGSAAAVQTNLDTLNTQLATIAKTGNVNDLIQTTGDVLVFDCGTSTKNV